MRLTELEPRFLKILDAKTDQMQDTLEGATGIIFLCPKCFEENKGPVGTHSIICYFNGVDPEKKPGPGRWDPKGNNYEDLTLTPSIQVTSGCGWHGFVTNGEVRE